MGELGCFRRGGVVSPSREPWCSRRALAIYTMFRGKHQGSKNNTMARRNSRDEGGRPRAWGGVLWADWCAFDAAGWFGWFRPRANLGVFAEPWSKSANHGRNSRAMVFFVEPWRSTPCFAENTKGRKITPRLAKIRFLAPFAKTAAEALNSESIEAWDHRGRHRQWRSICLPKCARSWTLVGSRAACTRPMLASTGLFPQPSIFPATSKKPLLE